MKTNPSFQQFKTLVIRGIRAIAIPTLLINIVILLWLARGLDQAAWDIEFLDGVIISLLMITPFLLISFLGIIILSLIISSNSQLSNVTVFILGALIGIVIAASANFVSSFFGLTSYEFTSLPSVSAVILLASAGHHMNSQVSPVAETKLTEFRAVRWMVLLACVGSLAFALIRAEYIDTLSIYIYMGYALSISLPVAILAGFLLVLIVKKIPRPAFFNWVVWQHSQNTIYWVATKIKKRIGNHPIPKITAFVVLASGIFFGILYLKVMIPTSQEVWRINDNNLEDPIIVENLILFNGAKGDSLHNRCEYLLAVDKNTGQAVWSSENYTTERYCDYSQGPVYTAIILLPKGNVILVSSSYWKTDDEQDYVLYALSKSTGEFLWKVNGYAGYPYAGSALLDYSSSDTNYVYVASQEGLLSAIDSGSGKMLWQQQIPVMDYAEDILIEYKSQVVYFYYSGDNSITAFDAKDGNRLWGKSNLNYVRYFFISDNLIYLPAYSYTDLATSGGSIGSPYYLTALDRMTGKQVWEITFEQKFAPWAEVVGNKLYILTDEGEGFGDDFQKLRSLMQVDKNTGETIWQFNEDYSHGDLNYFIHDDLIYIGTNDNYLFALDDTGKVIWQTEDSGFPFSIYANEGTVVVVYEEKYAAGFDTKTGEQKWILDVGMDKFWYPDDFIIATDDVIYIAGAANRKVYAIDIETGKILWSWNHYHPRDKAYMLKALDGNTLYVDQYRRFLGYDWFFALDTENK